MGRSSSILLKLINRSGSYLRFLRSTRRRIWACPMAYHRIRISALHPTDQVNYVSLWVADLNWLVAFPRLLDTMDRNLSAWPNDSGVCTGTRLSQPVWCVFLYLFALRLLIACSLPHYAGHVYPRCFVAALTVLRFFFRLLSSFPCG